MRTVKNYLSLIKFSHTIFAMPFAMIGFFLALHYLYRAPAEGDDLPFENLLSSWFPDKVINVELDGTVTIPRSLIALKLGFVLLCMVFARSAMAFNRYLDRKFDAKNPRTAIREIPAGIISANRALTFTIICAALFVLCCWFINPLCFYLSPVALFVVLGYSYTKRFTPLCHLILGLGLSLAPIGAYLAVTGEFNILPILFSAVVFFWVSGFDIIYALQDEEFDKQHNLYSIPAALGKGKALRVSQILHFLSAAFVIGAGLIGKFGGWYWIGAGLFLTMLFYQHSIVKPNDLRKVNLAFMTANGIASIVFAIFVIADLYTRW
jgi:4-hydroxybenzoate polyprenyltransferase